MIKENNIRVAITIDADIYEQYTNICKLTKANKNKLINLFILKVVNDYENNIKKLNNLNNDK